MTLRKHLLKFYDANGYLWVWDGESVYIPALEPGVPHEENGYVVETLEEGIEILMEDGYMDGEY
jgi:hypothetical protein